MYGKWAITGTSIVMQIRWWSISKDNASPSSFHWYQNTCDASPFLQAKQNFRVKKMKISIFRPKFDLSLGSSSPKKYKDLFNNFSCDQTIGVAKISLQNFHPFRSYLE